MNTDLILADDGTDGETTVETTDEYGGVFLADTDAVTYQTADGSVTIQADMAGFRADIADAVTGSLYDDGVDHVALPFSRPTEEEGDYAFPSASVTTRDSVTGYLLENTRFVMEGHGQNPVDHLLMLLEAENPLIDAVAETLYGLPDRLGEGVEPIAPASFPWSGIVYQYGDGATTDVTPHVEDAATYILQRLGSEPEGVAEEELWRDWTFAGGRTSLSEAQQRTYTLARTVDELLRAGEIAADPGHGTTTLYAGPDPEQPAQTGTDVPDVALTALGWDDLPAETQPAMADDEPVEFMEEDDEDLPAVPAEGLGFGPWDDQIDSWTEE